MNHLQRHVIGGIGLIMLVLGLVNYIFGNTVGSETSSDLTAGINVRVGCVLIAIWLAYPQLSTLRNRLSVVVIVVLLLLLLVIAARPQLFPIAAVAALGALMINGALRRLSRASKNDN